jgi:hypothetical protein
MYPVPFLALQIERQWAPELPEYFGRRIEEISEQTRPWFEHPSGLLRIELMDRSVVQFHWAFHIVSEAKYAIAVFTEHCGNHVFPYHGSKVYRDEVLVYDQEA